MAFFTQKPPFDVTFKKPALRWAGWFNSLGGEPAFLRCYWAYKKWLKDECQSPYRETGISMLISYKKRVDKSYYLLALHCTGIISYITLVIKLCHNNIAMWIMRTLTAIGKVVPKQRYIPLILYNKIIIKTRKYRFSNGHIMCCHQIAIECMSTC